MDAPATEAPRPGIGDVLVGAGVAALGILIAVETTAINVAPTYAKVSPRLIPGLVAAGLIALGLALVVSSVRAMRAGPATVVAEGDRTDWLALAIILGGLVLHWLLLKPLGFIVASTVLYTAVVTGFGDRKVVRTLGIGLVLSVVVYFVFTRGLGLRLPPGILAGIL
ncbi:MAG: tripartite tricarboxylate transporter TctB family protein [Geminicoccaceae bacterium]